jgi:hypothetical protein
MTSPAVVQQEASSIMLPPIATLLIVALTLGSAIHRSSRRR